ncbi:MAG: glycosyltransferase family 4 protein [Planctomycetes bacterium]|nr:glycosyltransferase family 4 protein [Planctomycetota bacterium]
MRENYEMQGGNEQVTPMVGRPLRVLALTRTKPTQPPTWTLRVERLLPHLREQHGIEVDACRWPYKRADKEAFVREHSGYDVVWLHRYTTWPWKLCRMRSLGNHFVLDIDDPVGFSSSNFANFSLSRWLKFRATVRGCDAVLAASDGLVELAAHHNPRTRLVRLCADPATHSLSVRRRTPGEPLRLLWLGSRATFKYLEFVRPHLEAIGRLGRNIELVVVGHSRLELNHLRVTNIAWSREAELEQFARCHVGLVPLTDDRWTRAKATLKPLQYLANGLPFIASPVGVNLRISDDGRNGVLGATPDRWADAAERFEANEELRLQMGRAGIDYVLAHHSPEVLAGLVAAEFRALAGLTESVPLRTSRQIAA